MRNNWFQWANRFMENETMSKKQKVEDAKKAAKQNEFNENVVLNQFHKSKNLFWLLLSQPLVKENWILNFLPTVSSHYLPSLCLLWLCAQTGNLSSKILEVARLQNLFKSICKTEATTKKEKIFEYHQDRLISRRKMMWKECHYSVAIKSIACEYISSVPKFQLQLIRCTEYTFQSDPVGNALATIKKIRYSRKISQNCWRITIPTNGCNKNKSRFTMTKMI